MTDEEFAAWLSSETANRCILVEAQYFDKNLQVGSKTEYVATHPFVSQRGEVDGLDDIGYYEFLNPNFSYQIGINSGLSFSLKLFNNNNEFESWFTDREWVGWPIKILIGDSSWRRTDFRYLYTGIIGEVSYDRPYLEFRIYDFAKKFDIEVERGSLKELALVNDWRRFDNEALVVVSGSYTAYSQNGYPPQGGGPARWTIDPSTNLPVEIDPGALDVLSTLLENPNASCPVGLGNVFNAQPILIDYTDNRYIVNPPDFRTIIVAVKDKGVPVPFTLQADLQGGYLPSGQFRLLNQPVGTITCDFITVGTYTGLGELPYSGTVNQGAYIKNIIRSIVAKLKLDTQYPGIDSLLEDVADTTQVGIYSTSGITAKTLMDEVTASINGYWGFTRENKLVLFYLEQYDNYPTFTPDYVLIPDNIMSEGVKISEIQNAKAALKLNYFRNYYPTTKDALDTNVAGETPANENHNNIMRDILTKESMVEELTDNQVLVQAPLSEPKHTLNSNICAFDLSNLVTYFDAQQASVPPEYDGYHYTRLMNSRIASQVITHEVVTRIFELVRSTRHVYTMEVRKVSKLLNIGDTVAIMYRGFGLIEELNDWYLPSNNIIKVGLILRIEETPAAGVMRLTVWL